LFNQKSLSLLRIANTATKTATASLSKLEVFCNQLVDSFIVGGIAGLSAYLAAGDTATFKVFGLAFAMTFLVKMKDYRGLKN